MSDTTLRSRIRDLWARHRTLFWWLHSVWALATGIAVLVLARERYGFIPWVVAFLGITWASTLVLNRITSGSDPDALPGVGAEVGSWLTRGMFQETLFFLLPFYAYSTVIGSWNVVLPAALAVLALFSCADVVFDRWLRTRPIFGMLFFASVSFSALNLLLPMTLGLDPNWATPVSGLLAVVVSAPIAGQGTGMKTRREVAFAAAGAAAVIGVTLFAPVLVPPVPLRLDTATFASDIEREGLVLADSLGASTSQASVGGRMVMLAQVFAPASVPATVRIEWRRNGERVRLTREIEILAHGEGFRVWDAWIDEDGLIDPGIWEARLTTAGRLFGVASIEVTEGGAPPAVPAPDPPAPDSPVADSIGPAQPPPPPSDSAS